MSADKYPSIFSRQMATFVYIFPIFKMACVEKKIWTLSETRKTTRFSEQIMSADKYPSIFSRQMEAIVNLAVKANPHPPI